MIMVLSTTIRSIRLRRHSSNPTASVQPPHAPRGTSKIAPICCAAVVLQRDVSRVCLPLRTDVPATGACPANAALFNGEFRKLPFKR